jgi:hypothetical protein
MTIKNNNIISRIIRFSISLLLILVLYTILIRFFPMKEGFLTSGEYPIAVDKPLLYDSYDVADHPGADALGAAQIYIDYPVFPATSLENNNIRYWNKPTNGRCTAPDMCNGLYKSTAQRKFIPSKPPTWNNERRVNYQIAKIESCNDMEYE